MLPLMPQNRTSFSVPEVLSTAYTPQVTVIHERSKTNHSSNGIHPTYSNWSPHKKLEEVNSSMASVNLPTSPIGVLLPICLLAVFLSCVVCVYHWQNIRERRLDLEDERKRRLRIAGDFDAGCALKAYKPINKKVRMYPWKSTRIQELPDINNNGGFDIPGFSPGVDRGVGRYYGDSFRFPAMGHISENYERPELKRSPIHNNTPESARERSGFDHSSDAGFTLKLPSLWSADTATYSCAIASTKKAIPGLNDECNVTDIREEAVRVTHLGLDGQVVTVETMNGSLLEYWV